MTTRGKTLLLVVVVFVLGLVAGSGLGAAYGRSTADSALQQQVADLKAQYGTLNDNYLLVVREYNKLYGLKAAAAQPVAAAPAGGAAAPAVKATAAPAANATAEPAAKATAPAAATPAPVAKPATASAAEPTAAPSAEPTTAAAPTTEATAAPAAGAAAGGAPVVEFEGLAIKGSGPQEGPPPLTVKFTDKSTGNITSWEWKFGDGETSTEQNPAHLYKACPAPLELCTVTLKACGPSGCAETTKDEYIWVSESCTGC